MRGILWAATAVAVASVLFNLAVVMPACANPADREICDFVRPDTPIYVNPVGAREAAAACRRLLNAKPAAAEAATLQARLAWALFGYGDLKNAWRAAKTSTALSPTEPGGYEVRAAMARQLKQTADALAEIDKAQPYGLTYDGHYTRSRILQDLKRYDEAIAEADIAIRLAPDLSPPYVTRGVSQDLKGDTLAALESYRLAEKLDPRSPVITMNIAIALSVLNRDDEALRYVDRTLLLDPKYAQAHRQRAYLRKRSGELPGALDDYQRALRMTPKDASLWVRIALVQSQMGDDAAAFRATDRAESLDPKSADVWGARCWIAGLRDRDVAARMADCDRAVKMDPSADQLQTRALARQRVGDVAGALADADAAVAIDPKSADAHFMRGWVKAQQGKPGAQDDLIAALKIDPRIRTRHERMGLRY